MRLLRLDAADGARWAVEIGAERRLLPHDWSLADGLSAPEAIAARAGPPAPAGTVVLPPLAPGARVFCVGRNYRAHAGEMGGPPPDRPSIFTRGPWSFVGDGQALERPAASADYDYEGEIAVVIGRTGGAVGGYTLVMDGSVRDYQRHSLFAGKNFARSGSIGPAIVTADEAGPPKRMTIVTRLNGETVQTGALADLIFPIDALIAYLSAVLPLAPGDVIATGTPAGVGSVRVPPRWLSPGDELEVSAPGLGVLRNRVSAA